MCDVTPLHNTHADTSSDYEIDIYASPGAEEDDITVGEGGCDGELKKSMVSSTTSEEGLLEGEIEDIYIEVNI